MSISKEDIEAINKKNQRFIFVLGPPGCGKNTQSQKIVNEFKYSKLRMRELVKREIEQDTELGKAAKENYEKRELLPKELAVAILLKGISEIKEKGILIEGFPRTVEQALYFEQNVKPINLIINVTASHDECMKRMVERTKFISDEFTPERFDAKYEKYQNEFKPVYEFYSKYGVIRTINGEQSVGSVNDQLKQNLYPVVYSIIGKRYSGKTTLSKVLNERMGIHLIDFNEFLTNKEIKKRINDSDFVVSSFIAKLRTLQSPRVLIENFPQNKAQYSYFVNNCKAFETIYYLNADNSTCFERLNEIPLTDPNYTDCSDLNLMLYNFEEQKPFIDFLKKKTKIHEIDVNNHKVLTIERMMKQIKPSCVIVKVNESLEEAKKTIMEKLTNNCGYEIIDINQVIENAKNRNIKTALKETLTNEDKIELIRPLIFKENNNRFILENFPSNIEELNLFENSLCEVQKLIYVSDDKVLEHIKDHSIEVFFKNKNRLSMLGSNDITDFLIEECLDMTRDINIVYGMPLSGKTSIAKHLQLKYNFTMLDFKELIEAVKKTKIDPENPDAEPEIAFPDLVKGLKDYLEKEPKNKRVIVDNFFIPNAAEPFLIDTYEKAIEIINTIGKFRNLYEITCDEKTLINRYKAKEGIAEDLGEEQMTAFKETLDKPTKLLEEIKKLCANVIPVNTDASEEKTKLLFDFSFGRNFIVIKHEYDINIEKNLELFAAKNKLLYINVPKLLYKHFAENDEISKKLEDSYGKKTLTNEITDESNFEGYIYYKYNPIHFETSLVNQIILQYANEHYKEIEKSGNFILLSGYLNYDLLPENELPFNLPLFELKNTMELGDLTAFIAITSKEIKEVEDEEAIQLVIEKPKKVVQKDPLDVDGAEGAEENQEQPPEEQPPEEENADGAPKFKPEDYKWTSYDGVPRNYVQVLKRLKMYPVNTVNGSKANAGEDLERLLKEHLENYEKRGENGYKGVIGVVKV